MELIQRKPRNEHVSQDVIEEFEAAILADQRVHRATMNSVIESSIWFLHRALDRSVGSRPLAFTSRLLAKFGGPQSHAYFAVLMGLNVAKCASFFILPSFKSVYLFDAWPETHDKILEFAKDWKVHPIFVSSRQVAQTLNLRSGSNSFIWIPEGIDPHKYESRDYTAKDIDVLQLGRRYDRYHRAIITSLDQAKKKYLFEAVKGKVVFPTRQSFVDGLSRTRISICFPSSLTHPARSGRIETMTARYLQSLASKCLIVGHAPEEMIDLFGFNPVVEAQIDNAGPQLLDILANFDQYKPLIEKNYSTVLENHTWRRRWADIATSLSSSGGFLSANQSMSIR